ncbi:MAG: monovalent cation/H(+) antiporter subunit G [Phycisphaerales bacterium]|nr:monovalent cation/H(+) antiporter subunit G [Phycisphaerales bacterium]
MPHWSFYLALVLELTGAAFVLIAALGILLMPDLYNRMQAASKAATLGTAAMVLGAAVHFADVGVAVRAVMVAAFLFLTAPIAAHMLARAGYLARVPLSSDTTIDELQGRYNRTTHALASRGEPDSLTGVPRSEADRVESPEQP